MRLHAAAGMHANALELAHGVVQGIDDEAVVPDQPQLGARGVALVWRDPQPPANSSRKGRDSLANVSSWRTGNADGPRPHRTRILFYHQFD